MEFLSQHYLPGAITIWCALFFALASLWGYLRVMRGDRGALSFARRGYSFFALSIVLSTLVMLLCLARRDFRIEYVYQYSGLELPLHFQLSAFWAGQKGSFLIWLLWGALLGLPLLRSAGRDEAPVMSVYLMTQFGLLFIMVRENPFIMLQETPADGAGLNPLLQDNWMVIHPPVMFIGYAAGAIPLAFAWAAMWRRDTENWATRAFPWTLAGFLVLGTAILMGGYWAYRTLGWGGYWGWDPVENASLIPWLVGVILIHGLYLERTKKRYRRLNLILACALYMAVLYGTFLTRSGVLADFSVHSFVDLGISRWLVLWMAFFGLGSVYLLATRLRGVPTQTNEDPFLSRGAFLVMSTLVVGASTVLITIGTSAPLLTRFMENPGQVGPSFYNRVNMPLALALVLLLIPLPFLTWRGLPKDNLLRKLAPSFAVALLFVGIAAWYGVRDLFDLLLVFFAAAALAANLHKVIEMARNAASWPRGLASAGGYLAHVGVGVMLLGLLASSAYDQSSKVTLEQGVAKRVGQDLTLTFQRFIPRQGRTKERMEVEVVRDDGMRYMAYPKLFVNDRTRQLMANPHIYKTALRDFYISPIQYHPGQPPGVDHRMKLARGDVGTAGDLEIRFVDFNLQGHETQLASGGMVTVGAILEVKRNGDSTRVMPVYRFAGNGQLDTPPVSLPGGGVIATTGITPADGSIQLDIAGLDAEPLPAKLSIDVTQKPLINLVWYGLYIVLAGGILATFQRFKAAKMVDEIADFKAAG